ncbi:MAG TPA: family 78 glycoside hydrolase catalytic domain [Pseudonocardiaceae bacterium]|nr:family 78 glycoside hydrolase catalytic domain [Pseudonocardiaceae bacterium]
MRSGSGRPDPAAAGRAGHRHDHAGRGPTTWEPRFTLHGFRYAEVTGWPGVLSDGAVTARVHHTDLRRTGWFECADPLVNRLHENVVWSMRGNFVDIPTDCPARDEHLGWTGDLQIFAPTASFLYDCVGMLDSWLDDVAAEQLPDGTVPWYVPVIPGGPMWTPIRPGAAWGDGGGADAVAGHAAPALRVEPACVGRRNDRSLPSAPARPDGADRGECRRTGRAAPGRQDR